MNYGPEGGGMSKLEYAKRLAGTLAYIAAQQGDAVALYCVGKEFHKEIPPKRSATHLGLILDSIGEMEGRGETGIVEALHEAAEKIPQRALFVIISDLFVPEIGGEFPLVQPLPASPADRTAWWRIGPAAARRWLEQVGFGETTVTFHEQRYRPGDTGEYSMNPMYTIIGRRPS